MTYEIPGSNLSPDQIAAGITNAASEATLPSYTSMLGSITSGSFFQHPDMSMLSSVGIDTSAITGALNSAKASLLEDVGAVKAAIESQAKLAADAGTAFGEEQINSIIGSSPLALLSSIGTMVSGAVSTVTGTISGLVGDAQTAAVSALQSSIGSAVNSATSAASDARSALNDQLRAIGMANMLTSPMIPQIQSILQQNVDFSQFNGFKYIKTSSAPSPSIAKAPDPYRPKNSTTPGLDSNPVQPATQPAQQIFTSQIQGLNTDATSARVAYYNSFGANDSMSKDQVQEAFNSYASSHLTPDQLSIRTQGQAIVATQPDSSTWTEEQANIVKQLKELKAYIATTDWFNAITKLSDTNKKWEGWYKQAYACYMSNGNIYTLPTDLVAQLKTYA